MGLRVAFSMFSSAYTSVVTRIAEAIHRIMTFSQTNEEPEADQVTYDDRCLSNSLTRQMEVGRNFRLLQYI